MPVERQADLDAFCNPAEFGVAASVATMTGPVPVTGIFDEGAMTTAPGQSTTSYSPIMLQAADVTTERLLYIVPTYQLLGRVEPEQVLTITGTDNLPPSVAPGDRFQIADKRNDGGMTTLYLHAI